MSRPNSLTFRAGPGAIRMIRERGFSPDMIGTLAGASGGAKWLILSQLDRVVATEILPKLVGPVFTIGTSIGAWRFACYAQQDPVAAINRFEEAYLSQTYSEKPDRHEITEKSKEILDTVFGEHGVAQALSHPVLRTNVMTVRSKHIGQSENRGVLASSLLAAAVANAVSRRTLGSFFERALFYDDRDKPPFFEVEGFPLHQVPLTAANLKASILATGSIPLVLSGVRDIEGAPPGVYRDGGVIDYHLDLPHSHEERLTLYLHFIDRIVPGWFDKGLKHRQPQPEHVDRTLLICPSKAFVETLPERKIPDRKDFANYPPDVRERNWRIVVDRCNELADELNEVIASGKLAERLEPI